MAAVQAALGDTFPSHNGSLPLMPSSPTADASFRTSQRQWYALLMTAAEAVASTSTSTSTAMAFQYLYAQGNKYSPYLLVVVLQAVADSVQADVDAAYHSH